MKTASDLNTETRCTGKVAFATQSLAASVLRRRSRKGKACTAYHCPMCSKWHLGVPSFRDPLNRAFKAKRAAQLIEELT